MSRRISAFALAALIVFLSGCSSFSDSPAELCKNIASNYSCTVNIIRSGGDALCGGKLVYGENGYEYTLGFPEEIAGTVFTLNKDGFSAKFGTETVSLPETAVQKLLSVFGILDAALEAEELSAYESELYGSKCRICDFDGRYLYYANGVPLLIISNDIRAEITGFSAQGQ